MNTNGVTEIKNNVQGSSTGMAIADPINSNSMDDSTDKLLEIEGPTEHNQENKDLVETTDKTQNLGENENSLKDLSVDMMDNDGDDFTYESKEVTEEATACNDNKNIETSITETVENICNISADEEDMVLIFDDSSEQINITEEDFALPMEVSPEKTVEVEKCNLESNLSNISELIEKEIIAFKEMKKNTSLNLLKTANDDTDKTTEHEIKLDSELMQTLTSDVISDHEISLKEDLLLEDANEKNMSLNMTDDSVHANLNHGLNKPDMMLEIPTQELIDIDDVDVSVNSNYCNEADLDADITDVKQNNKCSELSIETVTQSTMEKENDVDDKCKLNINEGNIEGTVVKESVINTEIPSEDKNSTLDSNKPDVTVLHESSELCKKSEECIENALLKSDSHVDIPPSTECQQNSTDTVDLNVDDTQNNVKQNIPLQNAPNQVTNEHTENQDVTVKQSLNMSKETPDSNENTEDIDNQSADETTLLISTDDNVDNSESKCLIIKDKESETIEVEDEIKANSVVKNNNECDQIKSNIFISNPTVQEYEDTLPTEGISACDKVSETIATEIQASISKDFIKLTPDTSDKSPEVPTEGSSACDNISEAISKEMQASTSKDVIKLTPDTSAKSPEVPTEGSSACDNISEAISKEIQASTSNDVIKLTPDTSDEAPEVSDSLGLLAESSRVAIEDDEYQEEDEEEDDDSYPDDESSNQMTAEHSEDSNTHHSESDVCKEQEDKSNQPEESDDGSFQYQMSTTSVESVGNMTQFDGEATQFSDQASGANTEDGENALDDGIKTSSQEETELPEIESVKTLDTSNNEGFTDDVTSEPKDLAENSNSPEENKRASGEISSKRKKLEISHMKHVLNIVDLEESSSEDDIQEIQKGDVVNADEPTKAADKPEDESADAVMVDADEVTAIEAVNEEEVTRKKNNSDEVADKVEVEQKLKSETCTEKLALGSLSSRPKIGLEIFNLDSDEEDKPDTKINTCSSTRKLTAVEVEAARGSSRCVNFACASAGAAVQYVRADAACLAQYAARGSRHALVCTRCAQLVADRTRALVDGIKDMTPLLDLDMEKLAQDLVEISDSESEDEAEDQKEPVETIGEEGAEYLKGCLSDIINETWIKYEMDSRLREAHVLLNEEVKKLEKKKEEVDQLLADCQAETDKIRNVLYATFEPQREELPPVVILHTPNLDYSCYEEDYINPEIRTEGEQNQGAKRRYSGTNGTPAPKRPAIPLGYAPLEPETQTIKQEAIPLPPIPDTDNKGNDDKDVAVVQLSVESAPVGLPAPGEPQRPPLKVGMQVYAMRNSFGTWLKGKILECHPKSLISQFTVCRVKFDHKAKNACKTLPARCIAYNEPSEVRMTIGTRVISLFKNPANGNNKKESFYSGIVAEVPNPVNNYRYLVFFDDGYAQYASHSQTRLVCESSVPVWDEVHPFSREFVRDYLIAYPERPMVRLHAGQRLKTEWNGKWWSSKVLSVDASLVKVHFEEDNRTEWIYRGSTRLAPLYLELQAAVRHRPRPLPRSKAQTRTNMPYVEYTRSDEQATSKQTEQQTQQQQQEEIRRQRAVAKKSTVGTSPAAPPHVQTNMDAVTSRVVYYTPKNAVKPYKMVPHTCSPKCKRTDVLALKDLRTYNPLAKPLLSGWERQILRYKGAKEVTYRAPCGRRVRNMRELHRYLRTVRSDMPVDLFDFHPGTHCLAEFVLNKCIVGKKDLSHGKENVPVPCVNYYDDTLPEFCSYNTERTPTAGVPLNLDPAFLCGCDCTDDCQDKTKCACWKMTLEGARTIGLRDPNVGYVYKRLPEPLPSGIYECNSRCKCKHTCLNRVAQHPLQLKLQVFKTLNRGWGIRALNDVPKGSFLCVYAGNLLTDATANLDGLNEGDEYLAELDYIEVVEQMKEGYEEDIPEVDKKLDQKESSNDNTNEEESSSSEEENIGKDDEEDVDFRPGYIGLDDLTFNKRLRERGKGKKNAKESSSDKEKEKELQKEDNGDEDCITISDDEEVREPSRFAAQAGMGANAFISKYRSVRSYFGKDEACYIMDAKVQGNIGRYLNHSCSPNVFVQNVFVDTHDPRFPWVAFFALSHIRAGTELTWNYNYDVGSVPEKVLYCFCGAPNCRGRLL